MLAAGGAEGAQALDPPEFGRHGGRVHHVVAVGRAGGGLEDRGEVHGTHTEVGEVRQEVAGVGQGETTAGGVG